MALIETSLIWVTYAVCVGILFFVAGIFVFIYQKPAERSPLVTIVCFISVLALLATVLLMPVDVALVSSTTSRKLGAKKDWATPDEVDSIVYQLKIVYYTLYSLDAVLCLLVVPFTYFYYEEYDEVATDEGSQTIGSRLWGAFKYTFAFLLLVVILFLVGFFVPVAKKARDDHKDLDYFKDLLTENRKSLSPSVRFIASVNKSSQTANAPLHSPSACLFFLALFYTVSTPLLVSRCYRLRSSSLHQACLLLNWLHLPLASSHKIENVSDSSKVATKAEKAVSTPGTDENSKLWFAKSVHWSGGSDSRPRTTAKARTSLSAPG